MNSVLRLTSLPFCSMSAKSPVEIGKLNLRVDLLIVAPKTKDLNWLAKNLLTPGITQQLTEMEKVASQEKIGNDISVRFLWPWK